MDQHTAIHEQLSDLGKQRSEPNGWEVVQHLNGDHDIHRSQARRQRLRPAGFGQVCVDQLDAVRSSSWWSELVDAAEHRVDLDTNQSRRRNHGCEATQQSARAGPELDNDRRVGGDPLRQLIDRCARQHSAALEVVLAHRLPTGCQRIHVAYR